MRIAALNFGQDGSRIAEPVAYGTFLKTRAQNPRTGLMQWSTQPLPLHMLLGLKAQLEAALAHVDVQLTEGGAPLVDG